MKKSSLELLVGVMCHCQYFVFDGRSVESKLCMLAGSPLLISKEMMSSFMADWQLKNASSRVVGSVLGGYCSASNCSLILKAIFIIFHQIRVVRERGVRAQHVHPWGLYILAEPARYVKITGSQEGSRGKYLPKGQALYSRIELFVLLWYNNSIIVF